MRIEARDLSAAYGKQDVLHSISLCLGAGELVGLIGPNGSGKSTLLRALSGTKSVTQGSVSLDGVLITRLCSSEVARKLAFVPQDEPRLFEFTVREVVLMGRNPYMRNSGGPTDEDFAAAARAMGATDTIHVADRPITSLSGGEHRRVLIARALAQGSPTLLLDEPTAHVDIGHQAELLSICRRKVEDEGASVIAALHDLNLAVEFCDRLVLLYEGRIAADGPPEEALDEALLRSIYGPGVLVTKRPGSRKPLVLATDSTSADIDECTRVSSRRSA